jgi:hypothetical protein
LTTSPEMASLLSVEPTVPVPIPVSLAITEAVLGPVLSDARILALFAPRGARAGLAVVAAPDLEPDAAAGFRADVVARAPDAGALADLRVRVAGVAVVARDREARGCAADGRAAREVVLVAERRLVRRVAFAVLADFPPGIRRSSSSATARNSLTALCAALRAF